MAPKRKTAATSAQVAPGKILRRANLAGNTSAPWAWVGLEVVSSAGITPEHRRIACGFSERNKHKLCRNIHSPKPPKPDTPTPEDSENVIIISDDEEPVCTSKLCKTNPNCLNYIDTDCWLEEDATRTAFSKAVALGHDPFLNSRDPDLPAGLKNLGATCYANASLQVWFRDPVFRNGVYQCRPTADTEERFKKSPLYQLQVTFAALQEGMQCYFNPVRLVNSLRLDTTEQQDAQEFSKLFMSHLDTEFKKQASPRLRALVEDRFQGKQVYGTRCDTCQYQSERESDFLEIEVNFKNNSKLVDCIANSLQHERLTDDNQYSCPQCLCKRDATRYTELRLLPPVLHFSLQRFVYDFNAMERKKSKNCIVFPLEIDMGQHVKGMGQAMYELRGVLLHKGASAYHGHYEAQVFDGKSSRWYQFNDEEVTKIKQIGKPPIPENDKIKKDPDVINIEDDDENRPAQLKRKLKGKRRRIEDSDEERPQPTKGNAAGPAKHATINEITSRDAYMLIYTRKDAGHEIDETAPSEDVLDLVNLLNKRFERKCEQFSEKKKAANEFIDARRSQVKEILETWSIDKVDGESLVVSGQALASWLEKHAMEQTARQYKAAAASESKDGEKPAICQPEGRQLREGDAAEEQIYNGKAVLLNGAKTDGPSCIPLEAITCLHGRLDPQRAEAMKRISVIAAREIESKTNCKFEKSFTTDDVCEVCVENCFAENLYDFQHPQDVREFEDFEAKERDRRKEEGTSNGLGYWIPKSWLRDWKLNKPKMHDWAKLDPPPDADEWRDSTRCEHNLLSTRRAARLKISVEACTVLTRIFPTWIPIETDAEECAICEANADVVSGDKKEMKRLAENEKAKLKNLHLSTIFLPEQSDELVAGAFAMIPADFLKSWRAWVHRPTELQRPEEVHTQQFLCTDHGQLLYDPNCPSDMEHTNVAIITEQEWKELTQSYSTGPTVIIRRIETSAPYEPTTPICEGCRSTWKTQWETAHLTVRYGRQSTSKNASGRPANANGKALAPTRKNGARQSKRLRQGRELGDRRRIMVEKSTTVKEIKIMIEKEFQIAIMLQRVYHHGQELLDSSKSVADLEICANDEIQVEEEHEILDLSDDDAPSAKKRRRAEGRAFGGTVLVGGGTTEEELTEDDDLVRSLAASVRACQACTFVNSEGALSCEMCTTPF